MRQQTIVRDHAAPDETALEPMGVVRRWWLAVRPKTLPAAATGVLVGSALAWRDGGFAFAPALAALGVALLLQIASNLANDVYDHERGADTAERLGPLRVTQSGLLSRAQVKRGLKVVLALALALGVYLTVVRGPLVPVVGLAAIVAAVAYTGGPYPLGYHGLGEVFVFAFFGLTAVVGTYWVQSGATSGLTFAHGRRGRGRDHRHHRGEQPARHRPGPAGRQAHGGGPHRRARHAVRVPGAHGAALRAAHDRRDRRRSAARRRCLPGCRCRWRCGPRAASSCRRAGS